MFSLLPTELKRPCFEGSVETRGNTRGKRVEGKRKRTRGKKANANKENANANKEKANANKENANANKEKANANKEKVKRVETRMRPNKVSPVMRSCICKIDSLYEGRMTHYFAKSFTDFYRNEFILDKRLSTRLISANYMRK